MKSGVKFTLFSHFLKRSTVKMKVFSIIILILGLFLLPHLLIETWKSYNQKVTSIKQTWNLTVPYVVVHFDLKGVPPLLSYLRSTLQTLKDRGTTALLIEYEDMFPYEGILVNLSAKNHYDKIELKRFLMSVEQIGLEIIPLVPTFGHLEFALKLKEFQHLREHPKFPDSICPSKKESQDLIREMLRQVIAFHRKVAPVKHIHVGCDEVHQIKVCEICSKQKSRKTSIILEHLKFINDVLGELSPKTRILVWDDMLRDMHLEKSDDVKLPNMESVTWEYTTNFSIRPLISALNQHQRMFGNLWVASAYKGADGSTNTVPNLENRFLNHIRWLNFIVQYGSVSIDYNFKGIILTGRARYSHMEPPCELLPVAFPSIVLNLILIQKYHNGIALCRENHTDKEYEATKERYLGYFITDDLNSALMCQHTFFDGYLPSFETLTCAFEGVDLYVLLSKYADEKYILTSRFYTDSDDTYGSKKDSRLDDFKLGYLNMEKLKDTLDFNIAMLRELTLSEAEMIESMIPYFDKYVIEEYITFKLDKLKKYFYDSIQFLTEHYTVNDWPRRYSNSNIGVMAR
ncbi:hypothetical protein MSG28_014208 [Choristoneura fumiferana]|uniref:Uncharacterized protein n=1 Tax=Choristoneura fumiferana TaxID=7141 RepID=A0ACC0JG65_CHOFU|nr:hypothetical protein MSG28_014208 [Choristoneura fumiferana]